MQREAPCCACLLTVYGFETRIDTMGAKPLKLFGCACLLTVYGFETFMCANVFVFIHGCACLLTVYGFETPAASTMNPPGTTIVAHVSLPFTVLKRDISVALANLLIGVAHVSLPFTVLKRQILGIQIVSVAHVSLPFTVLKPEPVITIPTGICERPEVAHVSLPLAVFGEIKKERRLTSPFLFANQRATSTGIRISPSSSCKKFAAVKSFSSAKKFSTCAGKSKISSVTTSA